MNLRSIDLNLLTVFEAVYEERSQGRAADRLGMTQPAVSNALSRLRALVDDRLFQGRAKGLVTTAKADDLYRGIHAALDGIRNELEAGEPLDPATSRRTFVVTISFGGGALIGLRLFRRFRELAPHLRLVIRTIDPEEEIPRLLREQRLDLAVNHARLADPFLEQTEFMTFSAVVMARDGHPRIASAIASRERLMEEEFVAVHHHTPGFAQIAEMRPILETLRDRVALEGPNTMLLPLVVSKTDLLAITFRQMAALTAGNYDLRYYNPPFPIPDTPNYLIWHPSRRNDQAHRWLRQQCMAIGEELGQVAAETEASPEGSRAD
ncbi:LysR substrate-binding domain-containing protein [uncultured Thiodictyon sp.]|uniref:LysR substrate-binding domain-containing protein n=1 Tax=uncultured Thiodictyon sp. TaxID=1846217 RepID=UPI0025D6BB35|nr:LysR substrate-binding domain-containing protein [uncultured Thiodictyon sp.]